ncbi:lytic polysaccharide monooxygenase auxiliary activity family 9 protein [Streptomyces formicae]
MGDSISSNPECPDPSVFYHGFVTISRAALLFKEQWPVQSLEAGKFFPETASGLTDSFAPDDLKNAKPPADGKIASAGYTEGNAPALDGTKDPQGNDWKKQPVSSGSALVITWKFTAGHATRRYNYFMTKPDWDPTKPLARAQFETKPFHSVQRSERPYWDHPELNPSGPVDHTVTLPSRNGYHVLLGVWEVANTGNAFYQVVDLDFI